MKSENEIKEEMERLEILIEETQKKYNETGEKFYMTHLTSYKSSYYHLSWVLED